MLTKRIFLYFTILFMLLLAACQAASSPTAVEISVQEPEPTEPVEEPDVPEIVPPQVTVSDQEVVDGMVTISQVISNGSGWLVVHAQKDGAPGPILGFSPVNDGENSDVLVEIDIDQLTETVYAMLHTDAGVVGEFEFPDGPDGPVVVEEKVVTPDFQVFIPVVPSVIVLDQEIMDGTVTIQEVISDGPGWVVIHAQAEGNPGPILGFSPVSDGTSLDVTVVIDPVGVTETFYAMLHTDAGESGIFEFPGGPDAPVMVNGEVVAPSFVVSGKGSADQPQVIVSDQEIVDGMVTIEEVFSDSPGWLVIHAQAEGGPGPILGLVPVEDGRTIDLMVPIDVTRATEVLYAMLHTNAGETRLWEFPDGDDVPVKVDEQVVTPPFQVIGELPGELVPAVVPIQQEISEPVVNVPLVLSDGPGWLVIHAQADGAPGSILGYSPVVEGMNTNISVEIDPTQATDIVYAMLHTDAGEEGVFEFPGGDDIPVRVNDQVVTPSFELTFTGAGDAQSASGKTTVEILDSRFGPVELTVPTGTTVVWTNNGGLSHTVTADDNTFDSGTMGKGDTFSFTFNEPGTYPYYCEFHGGPGGIGMSGVITVSD